MRNGEAEKEKVQKVGGCRNHPFNRLIGLDRRSDITLS